MSCNLCGNEITKEEKSFIALPFGAICEECANEIESSKEKKMKDTMKTCLICFGDYLERNTKDHQCPDVFCGACGEQYDPITEQDENGFHLSEICGANDEETWANLPTTCADFVSHPHLVNGRGCYTCQMAQASEEQGTTALMSALLDIKIPCDVHQTGGFTMCVYIKTGAESYIYANDEGFSFYKDEDCEGWANYEFKESEKAPQVKAKAIAQTMKAAELTPQEI